MGERSNCHFCSRYSSSTTAAICIHICASAHLCLLGAQLPRFSSPVALTAAGRVTSRDNDPPPEAWPTLLLCQVQIWRRRLTISHQIKMFISLARIEAIFCSGFLSNQRNQPELFGEAAIKGEKQK